MVFDIIIAAVLIAFGLLSIYISSHSKNAADKNLAIVLLIGVAALIGGGWIILTKLTFALILKKFAGILLTAAGFFLIFAFPDASEYQSAATSWTGIFIGIVLFIVGLYLLVL